MRPTYYLNLQVLSYEEDEGTKILSENMFYKAIDKTDVYSEYNFLLDTTNNYRPDDEKK
jgi:hypothetical protein